MSPSGPAWSRKCRVERRRRRSCGTARDRRRREAGGLEARPPDRHVAAVDDDRDRVQQDADEREAQARLVAVDPQADEQQPERDGEERQTERLDDGMPASSANSVAKRMTTAEEQERRSSAAGRRRDSSMRPPARRPEDEAERRCRRSACEQVDRAVTPEIAPRISARPAAPAADRAAPGCPVRPVDGRRVGARGRLGHPVRRLGDERDRSRLRSCRPGSCTPSAQCVRTNASTTSGRTGCRRTCGARRAACSTVSGVMRYGRCGGHRLERVGHVQDPGELRDLVADEPVR